MTLVLEGIGDDKVRVNTVSLDTLVNLPEQALEIVGLGHRQAGGAGGRSTTTLRG